MPVFSVPDSPHLTIMGKRPGSTFGRTRQRHVTRPPVFGSSSTARGTLFPYFIVILSVQRALGETLTVSFALLPAVTVGVRAMGLTAAEATVTLIRPALSSTTTGIERQRMKCFPTTNSIPQHLLHYPRCSRRAIERKALWTAEDAARELPNLPLEDALQLVHLYAERGIAEVREGARAVG
jgi:hypothetical protein